MYIEHCDSVFVSSKQGETPASSKLTAFGATLKWLFWCIIALIALVVTIRIFRRRASS